jgi:Protein of unknown function (DUF2510)/Protein of unknown function (DUF3592)
MAGQAGWYRAPGEEGLLRYWNGTTWTDHRQPDPSFVVVPPPPVIAPEPDLSMAEYERQFTPARGISVVDQQVDTVPSSQPQYRPQAPFIPEPQPEPALSSQQGFVMRQYAPVTVPAAEGLPVAAVQPTVLATPEVATAAPQPALERAVDPSATVDAPTLVGFGRTPKSVLGALRGMAAGILVVLVGAGIMTFMSLNSSLGAGQAAAAGIVTSLGSTSSSTCEPVARFAVTGRSYTTGSSVALTPCPVSLGENVTVIYSTSNPGSGASIELGTTVTQFLWVVPVLGALLFFASLWTFIVRAGSIGGGIALIRDGRRRSRETASTP